MLSLPSDVLIDVIILKAGTAEVLANKIVQLRLDSLKTGRKISKNFSVYHDGKNHIALFDAELTFKNRGKK